MCELLVETGAYKDLDKPVILASGQLGIYFVNTEKLAQDGGEFERFGDDSAAMVHHAVQMMEAHPSFREVIDIIANEVRPLTVGQDFPQISGGQRRDWLFSGPVAYVLGLPHISLYKDGNQPCQGFEILTAEGSRVPAKYCTDLKDVKAIHVVDLLTEASSCCKEPNGWVPQLRRGDAEITDLFAITTRLQGGEQNLQNIGVNAHTFVAIDEAFLRTYSRNPERALDYQADPGKWALDYLAQNGALEFVGVFDPIGKKLDKAAAFLKRYGDALRDMSHMRPLEAAVQERYGRPIAEILSGGK
jgi:orotate phosphoribosyltransferase